MNYSFVLIGLLSCLPLLLPAQPVSSLKTTPLTSRVWVHTSYKNFNDQPFPSNGLIVEGDSSVLLVDTAWDSVQTVQLLQWIDSTLAKPVVAVVATHGHRDRLGGAGALTVRSIPLYISALTYQQSLEQGDTLSASIFRQDTTFSVGGSSLEVVYPGPGHTADNHIVWLPERKILYGGCLVKSKQAAGLGNTADADLKHWPQTIGWLLKTYDAARWVVPGHQNWNRPGTPGRSLLTHTLLLLRQAHVDHKP